MLNRDILTIDDLPVEIAIGIVIMRRRKERRKNQVEENKQLKNANIKLTRSLHAVAGWPVRLALPAPEGRI